MLSFPQLSSGGGGQYPIRKHSVERTIVNTCEDGHTIKLSDPGASARVWQLALQDLTDDELTGLEQFFTTAEGRLHAFTFLDPVGNLLMWSETLDQTVWEKSSLLQLQAGIADPNGGLTANRLVNTTGADLTLQQTVNAPGQYVYCFSMYARSASGGNISVYRQAGSTSNTRSYGITSAWKRISLSANANTTEEALTVGAIIPAGQSVDLFGIQLEAQPGASTYKRTFGVSGVYPNAHFAEDIFTFTTDGPSRHHCTLRVTTP